MTGPIMHEAPRAPVRANLQRWLPLALIAAAGVAAVAFDLHEVLRFDALRTHSALLTMVVADHSVLAAAAFVLVYAIATAVSLPGGAMLSIVGGFLFGGLAGGALVVIGATIGAVLVFLAARSALGDVLRRRAGPWLAKMEQGFKDNALSYMLVLRLVPLFPFFVVNLVPAFLGVPLAIYALATAIGIVPGSLVLTFAGAGISSVLAQADTFSVSAVFTTEIVIALSGLGLLSLLPVVYKRRVYKRRVYKRRVYKRWASKRRRAERAIAV